MADTVQPRLVACPVCRTVNRAGAGRQHSCASCGNLLPPPTKYGARCPSCRRLNNIGTNRGTTANCSECSTRLPKPEFALVTCMGCATTHRIAADASEPLPCTECGRALPVPDRASTSTYEATPKAGNDARPTPPVSVGEYWDRIGLFDNPAWKDPAFFIGWILTVLVAISRVVTVGQRGFSSTTAGVVSGLLGGASGIALSVVLFCVLPAYIRKLLRQARLRRAKPTSGPAQWLPDPVRRGQLRLWDGSRWTDKARGGQARPRQGLGVVAVIAAGALIVGVAAAVTAGSGSSRAADRRTAEEGVANAYQQLVTTVNSFESDAKAAAQTGGPAGLAQFVIANGDGIRNSAQALASAVNRANLPASYRPDPALLAQAASAGAAYGNAVSLLANDLGRCGAGDVACYQAAFAAGDARGDAGRDQLIAAGQAIEQQAAGQ